MSNTYLNGSWDAVRYRMWDTDRWRDRWLLDCRRSETMLGQLTQIELEHLVDDLQHGNGIDPVACTRHTELPEDYVHYNDTMTKADMRRLDAEDAVWCAAHAAQLRADREWLRQSARSPYDCWRQDLRRVPVAR